MDTPDREAALRSIPKPRVWSYRPSWWWYGWRTLLPVAIGHDEFSRETIMLGWTVTGIVSIPFRYCRDEECYAQSLRWAEEES